MEKLRKNRIREYFITVIIVIILNFFLPRAMPGDPFLFLSSEQSETVLYSAEQREEYLNYYGLNNSGVVQFFNYLKKVLSGDLGQSLYYNESVSSLILRRFLWTFMLVLSSIIISTTAAIIIGTISAWYKNSIIDKTLYLSLIIISEIPAFLLALILLFVFGAQLNIFPLAGAVSHFKEFNSTVELIFDIVHHAVLPIIALSISRLGGSYLLSRNSTISVLKKDYIRTAKAKGLSRKRFFFSYLIKNSLLPIITRTFLSLGGLIGGSVLVENVFSYPGLGTLMREAVMFRDYPLIQGIFLLINIFVLISNYLADFIYKKIDPRIESKGSITKKKRVIAND